MSERPEKPYVDDATAAVLGTETVSERLAPASEAGRRGVRKLTTYRPGEAEQRADEIDALRTVERWHDEHGSASRAVRKTLSHVPRIEGVVAALTADSILSEEDLFTLKQFCFYGSKVLDLAEALVAALGRPSRWQSRLVDMMEAIHPGGSNTPRFHLSGRLDAELDDLLDEQGELREEVRELRGDLEADIVDAHGGRFDLQGAYHPDDTTDEEDLQADDALHVAAGEWRLAAEPLVGREERLDEVRDEIRRVEASVRGELSDTLAPHADWLDELADFVATLDLRLAKLHLKQHLDGCWGEWEEQDSDGATLAIDDGREPAIAASLAGTTSSVQPVDFELGERPAIITGPNMGGKSALLRLAGLCQWCAQHAMPVPAAAFRFQPVDGVVYIGSEEPHARDASQGLSSFGREVRRLVDALADSRPPTLWLLDEVGRGTHPDDGAELAIEVIERLHAEGHRVIAATHFPAVAAHDAFATFRIRGITDPDTLQDDLAGAEDLETITDVLRRAMDYQPIASTGADVPRDARLVARALGLPPQE